MAKSRTSAPAAIARGTQTTSALCLALVEQPQRQKPRCTHGGDLPCGAETVASGIGAHFMPMLSQPTAIAWAQAFSGCGR